MRAEYASIVDYILDYGYPVTVRGQATREVIDGVIVIRDPTDALPIGTGRGLNTKIGAIEALQLIGGVHHPDLQSASGGRFMASLKDGGTYHGAYGLRTRAQWPAVVDRLKADPTSRQAVVTIWQPLEDLFISDSKDFPCTVMLQFLIRNNRLIMHTTMRSNDVWLGLAYDAFQFTQVQLTIARVLGIEPGPYYHHAVSMHLYERDERAARKLSRSYTPPDPHRPLGVPGATMIDVMLTASSLLRGELLDRDFSTSTFWYAAAVKQVRDSLSEA